MMNAASAIPRNASCLQSLNERLLSQARLLCPRYAVEDAVTVGPSILHPENHGHRENQDEPLESAILPQMHEKQKRQRGLDAGHDQHAHKHLMCADVLIGDEKLYPGQGQNAYVDDEVFAHSVGLRFGASHIVCS